MSDDRQQNGSACLDDATVHALLSDPRALGADTREQARRHLASCDRCRQWVASLARTTVADSTVRLGRYELGDPLGAGGMGLVYRAFDPVLGRDVAIKLIQGDDAGAEERARLLREARTLASISHPNVVAVFDAGDADGELYYAMEVLEGPTLRRWARAEPRTWRDVASVGVTLARALQEVHARDITHRDIKPDNIIMTAGGQPILVDFGLAQTRVAGDLAGTLGYMAPEVLAGGSPSPLSDQYALAMTLREAELGCDLTVIGTDREPPVSPRLEGVLSVALSEDPNKRYRDMDAFAAALERALGRSRRRRMLLAGAIGAIVLTAAAVVVAFRLSAAGAPECAVSDAALDQLWPGRRAEVSEQLADHGLQLGDRADLLDSFARSWKQARANLCAQEPPAGSERAARQASRIACLESTRAELDTLLGLLAGDDRDLARHGLARLPEMTPPAYCLRPSTVSLATPPPPDRPELAAKLDRLLATASLLYSASRLDEARPLLERARRIADELGHAPSKGRVYLLEGARADTAGKFEHAIEALTQAIDAFERGGDDLGRGRALVHLCGSYAESALHTDETESAIGEDYCRRAGALVDRLDLPWLRAQFEDSMGLMLLRRNDPAGARVRFESAAELFAQLYGKESSQRIKALNNLASITVQQQDWDAAGGYLRENYETAHRIHGERHVTTAIALAQWATHASGTGDFATAIDRLERALAIFVDVTGLDSTMVLITLTNICQTHLNQKDTAAAISRCREALETAIRRGDRVGDHHYRLGEACVKAGRLEEAERQLERAIELIEPDAHTRFTGHWGVARFQLALLLHDSRKQRARARTLAREAREFLLGLEFGAKYRDWIERHWHKFEPVKQR